MSLPDVCPLDNKPCKGRECHLYCVEWRTKEPMCLVGYRSTGKTEPCKTRFEDTYAENTFKRLGRQSGSGQQKVPAESKEDEKPAEKKRRKFKPWPEFPVKKRVFEASEESHESHKDESHKDESHKDESHKGKLRSWETIRPDEGLKPENPKRTGKAVRCYNAGMSSSRPEAHLIGRVSDEKELPVKNPPQFKEKVISKDINATLFSSVSEPEKPTIRPSGREKVSVRKSDEEREKRRKLDKVMKLDLPDEPEEEFWS